MDITGAAFVVMAAIICSVFGIPFTAAENEGPFEVRIACGSTVDSVALETGYNWSKDRGYTGGSSAPLNVTNRIAPQLNTLRYFEITDGPDNCYNISVPSGHYLVRFFFSFGAEDNGGREPIFEVSLEGTLVHSLAPGWSSIDSNAYAESLLHITDGAATVCFHSAGHGNPAIASLEILQLYVDAYNMGSSANLNVVMRTVKRVSAGAEESGFGSRVRGDEWGGDRHWATDQDLFVSGCAGEAIHTLARISNFGNPPNVYPEAIYQSATTIGTTSKLSYTVSVQPNQNYSVWLHFAEIHPWITGPNMRVFDVMANGALLFQGIDIVKIVGEPFKALTLNKTVMVTSSNLTISFVAVKGPVAVNALEVFQIIPRGYETQDETVWALHDIKHSLQLPSRLGWNGDPCAPPLHPWEGVSCAFDSKAGAWFVSAVNLNNEGLRGQIGDTWPALRKLQALNLSNNFLEGEISSFGNMTSLTSLLLNDNFLSGELPGAVGALPIRGTIMNVTNNPGLCGIGIRPCSTMPLSVKLAVTLSLTAGLICLVGGGIFCWKRKIAITRPHRHRK
uniref:Malectin-like domain-containing protein n=1 Tax=Physcomitrium patens TaxID=3218 RepID=A0A2K1ICV2_PHYPA|nr:hypothetical protein PHYPA_030582 [Physcomitrium patens]